MKLPKIKQVSGTEYGVYAVDEEGIVWKYNLLTTYADKNGKRTGWEKVVDYVLEPK